MVYGGEVNGCGNGNRNGNNDKNVRHCNKRPNGRQISEEKDEGRTKEGANVRAIIM